MPATQPRAGRAPKAKARPAPLDVEAVRRDFPILSTLIRGLPLVYLDNAASAQRPRAVLDAMEKLYCEDYANIHRGVYLLSQRATEAYEGARTRVQRFLNAASPAEIIFTRGTTESINLVARSFGGKFLGPGDEVLLSGLEHHSNIVPWQMICAERGARIKVLPIDDRGELRMDELDRLLTPAVKLVAVAHASNALGTVSPVRRIIERARRAGARVLVDGAQAVPHMPVDVRALDADFYAFSSHKLFGPTGVGVLYGKQALLETMPPYQGGGDMILSVSFEESTFNELPYKFEAGTPNIAGVVGLGAALAYMDGIGWDALRAYETELAGHAASALGSVPGLRMVGTAREKVPVFSFVLDGVHAHDIGTILDRQGIAVRTGHHCAQPALERLGVPATARASLAFYNTRAEVDRLVQGLEEVRKVFR